MFRTIPAQVFIAFSPLVYCLDIVKYGAFTQTATYSIANQLNIFQTIGLNVTYHQIPNSTFAYANLLNDGYDVLTGTIDNVVNLRFNQNASLTVLSQLDAGPDIVIAAVPNITSIHQLRGKSILVDSPSSGYTYILRKTLSLYGLRLENGDYIFQTAGSTPLRYQYLTTGVLPNGTVVYATILTYPFTQFIQALPLSERPNILARISDVIQPLSSTAITVSEASLVNTSKRDVLKRFLVALYAANRYLAVPDNKDCVTRAIQRQLNVSEQVAKGEYVAATDPISGESISSTANFNVSRQGLLNVIDVRAQFGGFSGISNGEGFDFLEAIESGIGKMIDYSVRNEAIGTYGSFLEDIMRKGSTLCEGI